MSLEIIPSGAALGAEIRGVDPARLLDDATFAAIERAYATHGIVFFRDQRITPPQHVHRAIQDYDLPLRRLVHRTTTGGATPR